MTPAEFQNLFHDHDPEAVLEMCIFEGVPVYVSPTEHDRIRKAIAFSFSVTEGDVQAFIVGSAKLGFSISEKTFDGKPLPRYRPFNIHSDIDVAVVAPLIFDKVWEELSTFSHASWPRPWKAGRLGDYLVCGWLRPRLIPLTQVALHVVF